MIRIEFGGNRHRMRWVKRPGGYFEALRTFRIPRINRLDLDALRDSLGDIRQVMSDNSLMDIIADEFDEQTRSAVLRNGWRE